MLERIIAIKGMHIISMIPKKNLQKVEEKEVKMWQMNIGVK